MQEHVRQHTCHALEHEGLLSVLWGTLGHFLPFARQRDAIAWIPQRPHAHWQRSSANSA